MSRMLDNHPEELSSFLKWQKKFPKKTFIYRSSDILFRLPGGSYTINRTYKGKFIVFEKSNTLWRLPRNVTYDSFDDVINAILKASLDQLGDMHERLMVYVAEMDA